MTPTPAPCGTRAARRRHQINNQTCETCETIFAKAREARLAPCGTEAARRRHRTNNETCTNCPPPTRTNTTTRQPCGTPAAYKRGCRCTPCKDARREYDVARRLKAGIKPANETMNTAEVINEIEFLLKAGEGEHRIIQALGYVGRENTLLRRLYRAGRNDLATQIFKQWELAA